LHFVSFLMAFLGERPSVRDIVPRQTGLPGRYHMYG